MKRLVLFIALMFTLTVISEAQIATKNLEPGETYWNYPTDVTLTNTTAKYFAINSQSDYYTAQNYVIHLDSASGNHTNVALVLTGMVSSSAASWTTISTINWKGTTSDTTIIYTNATETPYRRYRLTLTGTGTGTTTIANFEWKEWYGLP